MPPSIIGSAEKEAVYIGLCTMIVTLISLSPGGAVPDHKLMHLLKQLNADENTPLDKTSTILSTMIKQGYIVRTVEKNADEETTDWRVGPRGKVEISNKGIQGFVQEIYGDDAPEDLEARLQRSLKMEVKKVKKSNGAAEVEPEVESEEEQERNGDPGPSTLSRRSSGRRR
jgi:melanoma-associated antigen